MRTVLPLVLVTLLAATGPASAQTAEGSQSQGTQQGDSVQAGAGTKGDVTPGSSGPHLEEAGQAFHSLPATFPIKPPADPFYGPAMLPVVPRQMRCEVIGDPAARRRCEGNAQRKAEIGR